MTDIATKSIFCCRRNKQHNQKQIYTEYFRGISAPEVFSLGIEEHLNPVGLTRVAEKVSRGI